MSIDNSLFAAFVAIILCGLALVGFILIVIGNLIIGILMLPLTAFLIAITEDMHLPRFERKEAPFATRFDQAWELVSSKYQPY